MKCKSMILSQLVLLCSYAHGCEDFANIDLDTYLNERGVFITEGYVTVEQKAEFIQDLQKTSSIKKILEIGFNAGHSSELFLSATECEKLVSIDINIHPYVKTGVEFMKKKFGDRFTWIEGDSQIQVPRYVKSHRGEKFDLIFIDGGHWFECCYSDIWNCSFLAHEETILWIDDYGGDVKAAVDNWAKRGLITLLGCKSCGDDSRTWAIARYNPRVAQH